MNFAMIAIQARFAVSFGLLRNAVCALTGHGRP